MSKVVHACQAIVIAASFAAAGSALAEEPAKVTDDQ